LGIIFGFKLGLMNWGLSQLDLGKHFLLQAASLFWTVLFAWIFLREKPTIFEAILCLLVITGETLVSYEVGKDMGIDGVAPLLFNLMPPLLLGLLLILLRKSTAVLMSEKNGVTSFEFTGIKLALSALTVLPFALLFEGFMVAAKKDQLPFWTQLQESATYIPSYLVASIALTLVFQVTLTAMSFLAGAITVGVASEVKVVVQVLIVNLVQSTGFEASWTHIVGTILVLGSAVAFSILKYFKMKQQSLDNRNRQLEEVRENETDGQHRLFNVKLW